MHLRHPDWLQHVLTVIGAPADLDTFVQAARGSGYPSWLLDYDDMADHLLHLMIAPSTQGLPLSVSFQGCQIIARQYRDLMMEANHNNQARAGYARDVPLDLASIVPVPWDILRLGERDPKAEAWLWENWGTVWPLRRVEQTHPLRAHLADARPEETAVGYRFFSADWTPWPAIATARRRWPTLRFHLTVDYARETKTPPEKSHSDTSGTPKKRGKAALRRPKSSPTQAPRKRTRAA